jgi:hypothetical protein
MATTTTNYGFDVPTSSDLVKNGATQIALLGQDLDTFLFRPFTRNAVLNSSFNVWQRGTSTAGATGSTNGYAADRWQGYRGAFASGMTLSRQVTGDTTNLPFIQYCARVQRDNANAGTNSVNISQNLETFVSIPYAGRSIVLSFYARAGANYSSASSALLASINSGTGTDQNGTTGAGYTGNTSVIAQTVTLTTTWQRFSVVATMPSTATEFYTNFAYTPVGTAGANDYFEVTGVMVEVGSQASPYAAATPTYATELAACQRYYQVISRNDAFAIGMCPSSSAASAPMPLLGEMRVAPTIVIPAVGLSSGQIIFLSAIGGGPATTGTITANQITKNGFLYVGAGFTASFVSGDSSFLYTPSPTDVVKASAEL